MTRRKREIVGLRNERYFPHLVELALPLGPFRSVILEIDAFHRERTHPSPPRPESTRRQASLYSILLSRHRYCGCLPQGGEYLSHTPAKPKPQTSATSSAAPAVKRVEPNRPKRRVRAIQYGRR